MNHIVALLAITLASSGAQARPSSPTRPTATARPDTIGRVRFPADPSVLDAKRDLGARGDGKTDDTDALQRGLDECLNDGRSRVLYLPNGVYRLTRSLVHRYPLGPWIYGESRDGVVIKLDDGVKDCSAVLRTHPREKDPGSADWFMRNLRNFTVDVGHNPSTDGIRYFATNTGILKNVRVICRGRVGVESGFMGMSGPNLIQDVTIDGFETGINSTWMWGQTLSRITIRNCRKVGVVVNGHAVGIEDLIVENTPQAILCDMSNDWFWWAGVIALTGGRFTNVGGGAARSGSAIVNKGVLYLRNVTTRGFEKAVSSASPGGDAVGPDVPEYLSHPARSLFDTPAKGLNLPIKPEPVVRWETDPSKWVCANDFGAMAGDNQDDTAAFQKAIDAAAKAGKTTVYMRGCGGPDPNWYEVRGEVRVHGSVRHILGLGWGRIIGGDKAAFVVTDASAPVVKFQNIDSFGGPTVTLENRSTMRTMVAESCGVTIVGSGRGDIFATDCPARVDLRSQGQRMWARHLNPEGDDDVGLVRNAGADLWICGAKNEGKGVRFRTSDGGRTEVFGLFNYGPGSIAADDMRPMFDTVDAAACFMGVREIGSGNVWNVKARERRGAETRTLSLPEGEHGWIGWSMYGARPRP
ncbi:MAG: hypothetical protein GX446_08390 [Chthonomonadales bacterium]|nr:hypothetical protein [Chthonomonadales bacterium]